MTAVHMSLCLSTGAPTTPLGPSSHRTYSVPSMASRAFSSAIPSSRMKDENSSQSTVLSALASMRVRKEVPEPRLIDLRDHHLKGLDELVDAEVAASVGVCLVECRLELLKRLEVDHGVVATEGLRDIDAGADCLDALADRLGGGRGGPVRAFDLVGAHNSSPSDGSREMLGNGLLLAKCAFPTVCQMVPAKDRDFDVLFIRDRIVQAGCFITELLRSTSTP